MRRHVRRVLHGFPRLESLLVRLLGKFRKPFQGSRDYWEHRYGKGGDSGAGSAGRLARYKADFLNRLVADRGIHDVIEFGCGDGHQLSLMRYPAYAGVDVSVSALQRCRERFADRPNFEFVMLDELEKGHRADLTLSLDVIYHLVEDEVFESHMRSLFDHARDVVVIYSSNTDQPPSATFEHIRHRCFSDWIERNEPDWRCVLVEKNPYPWNGDPEESSWSNFHVYVHDS